MSVRASRWILWISLVLMVPVPVLVVGPALVPTARVLMLGTISLSILLLENARGAVGLLTLFLFVQALLYMGLLWLGAYLISRVFARFSRRTLAATTLLLIATGLFITSAFDVYHDAFRVHSAHANLLHVFE